MLVSVAPRISPRPERTVMSKDHPAPAGMSASRTLTPFPEGVDVPPTDADVSDTYASPGGNVAFTQSVCAMSPLFVSATVMENVSLEWIVGVELVIVIETTGPSRTTSALAV